METLEICFFLGELFFFLKKKCYFLGEILDFFLNFLFLMRHNYIWTRHLKSLHQNIFSFSSFLDWIVKDLSSSSLNSTLFRVMYLLLLPHLQMFLFVSTLIFLCLMCVPLLPYLVVSNAIAIMLVWKAFHLFVKM